MALIPAAAGIDEPSFASCVLALDVTTTFCQYHDSLTILLVSGLKSCKSFILIDDEKTGPKFSHEGEGSKADDESIVSNTNTNANEQLIHRRQHTT